MIQMSNNYVVSYIHPVPQVVMVGKNLPSIAENLQDWWGSLRGVGGPKFFGGSERFCKSVK